MSCLLECLGMQCRYTEEQLRCCAIVRARSNAAFRVALTGAKSNWLERCLQHSTPRRSAYHISKSGLA